MLIHCTNRINASKAQQRSVYHEFKHLETYELCKLQQIRTTRLLGPLHSMELAKAALYFLSGSATVVAAVAPSAATAAATGHRMTVLLIMTRFQNN
jgi:hypothetical protein